MVAKKAWAIGIVGCLAIGGGTAWANTAMHAADTTQVEQVNQQIPGSLYQTKSVKLQTKQVNIQMEIPVFEGLKDKKYEAQLNDIIMRHAMKDKENVEKEAAQFAEEAKKNGWEMHPYELTANYKVTTNGSVVSLAVNTYTYTGGANGISRTDYYNILNQAEAKNIQLSNLFKENVDYKKLLNQEIKKQINEHPEKEQFTFTSISDTQSFSIEHSNLVIHFAEYEITPGYMGEPRFEIPIYTLKNDLLPQWELEAKAENDVFRSIKVTKSGTEYIVTGQARVFEGTYNYAVKKGNETIGKGHGTASVGGPAWGDIKQAIKIPDKHMNAPKTLTLELFEINQENGQPVNKLVIPLVTK
ncbi:DUF4163 domain-containing protein [Aneurinibacillus migulanus]|uniref:DUF3298 domain-containing protein n=1 Tax=Aneurinibacillus migulanus TaxID=47500 RepID=UPI002E1CF1A1|nr:DUF4163 domain-containing protein [Aneurinibacillus migulanus]